MSKNLNLKQCKKNSKYNEACLKELQKFDCNNIQNYYDKRKCFGKKIKLDNFVSFLEKYSDFENDVLPLIINDLFYYCNKSLKQGKSPLLSIKNYDEIDIRNIKNINIIKEYPYMNKYTTIAMHIYSPNCEKILKMSKLNKIDMENYEPIYFNLVMEY